jgi:hypothetical protein
VFHNLLHLVTRRPPIGYDAGFVEEVRLVDHLPRRNRRAERLFIVCWVLIAVKCVVVTWLVAHYRMGFSPLWVTAPTVVFAVVCTAVYRARG